MLPSEIRKLKKNYQAEITRLSAKIVKLISDKNTLNIIKENAERELRKMEYKWKKEVKIRSRYSIVLLIIVLHYLWSML